MTRVATITTDCLPSWAQVAGATMTEDYYPTIDTDFRLYQRRQNSAWLIEVLDEIEQLAQLPAGWDSHGAASLNIEKISLAKMAIESLADRLRDLPRPRVVTASRSGGIQFEWGAHCGKYFELETVSPSDVEFLYIDPANGLELEKQVELDHYQINEIAGFISRTE
jgi:hypothetical protein